MCIPIDGYYDDGTNNSIAKPCESPCENCQADPYNCTSCTNDSYFVDISIMKCIPCSNSLPKCLICTDETTCS